MAAAVEQMTVSVSHISDSAQSASEKTADAAQPSRTGRCGGTGRFFEMREIALGIERWPNW